MRTQKELEEIIRESELFQHEDEEEDAVLGPFGPCWEVKVDREKNKLFFCIDGKDVLSHSLSKIKFPLSRNKLSELLSVLKKGDLKVLKKELEKPC
jgi:hypothetical protein